MEKIIVAAISDNHVLGNRGKLPWNMPADKAFFHETVRNQYILMGRTSWESGAIEGLDHGTIPIVVTRNPAYTVPKGHVVDGLDTGIRMAEKLGVGQLYILGGGSIYQQSIGLADRMIITEIHGTFEGDTFFPEIDPKAWNETGRMDLPADGDNPYDYSFVEYQAIS